MNMSTMRCCSTWKVPSVDAELLARLGVFQRRRIQLGHGADGFGAERGDGAVAAGFQRGDALAFRSRAAGWPEPAHSSGVTSAARRPSMVLKLCK